MNLKETITNFNTAIINMRTVIYLPPSVEERPETTVRINNITQEIVSLLILKY